MTVQADGTLLDRRRVELVAKDLPAMPHHHEGQMLPLRQAVALVARVQASARECAADSLAVLAAEVGAPIAGIALRACQPLPETVEERITNYRAMCVADWVMYRQALAQAAEARGWRVHWYDAKKVQAEAARALGRPSIDDLVKQAGKKLGPPWQQDHRTAMAAAIAAGAHS